MTLTAGRNVTLEDGLRDAEARYLAANLKTRARHTEACTAMPGGNTRSICSSRRSRRP
jgi:glutamate-1-semialdehyde 2,1-aminomutase